MLFSSICSSWGILSTIFLVLSIKNFINSLIDEIVNKSNSLKSFIISSLLSGSIIYNNIFLVVFKNDKFKILIIKLIPYIIINDSNIKLFIIYISFSKCNAILFFNFS